MALGVRQVQIAQVGNRYCAAHGVTLGRRVTALSHGPKSVTGQFPGFVWCQSAHLADDEAARSPFFVSVLHEI